MDSSAFLLLPTSSTSVLAYFHASPLASRPLSLTSAVPGTATLAPPLVSLLFTRQPRLPSLLSRHRRPAPALPMPFCHIINLFALSLTSALSPAPFLTGAASSSVSPPAFRTLCLLFTLNATCSISWPTGRRRATPASLQIPSTTPPLEAMFLLHAEAYGSRSLSFELGPGLPPSPPPGPNLDLPSSPLPKAPEPPEPSSSHFTAHAPAALSATAPLQCTPSACSPAAPAALSLSSTPTALLSVLGLLLSP